jgi:predicted RNase H-like HicB family nuclease
MQLTAVLTHAEEGGYVALNPESGTVSQGDSVETALCNLREATMLYLSEFPLELTGESLVTSFVVPDSGRMR